MSASETQTPCAAEHAGTEEAEAVEIRDRRRLEALLRRLHLVARLGEMDQRRHVVAPRQFARGLQRRAVERVHRVRRHGRRDQRVVLEGLDERLGAHQRVGRRLGVGDRKLDDRLAEHAAQPGRLRLRGDLLLEVVHVGEGRRARLNHLERREPRAGAHELRRDGLRFGREDVLVQPLAEREVVGQPAEQHHRRVGVGVDQTRQDDLAGGVDRLAAAELLGDAVGGIDGDDVGAVDRHRAVRQSRGCAGSIVTTVPPVTRRATPGAGRSGPTPPAQGHDHACGKGKNPDSHRGILVLFHPCLFTSLRIRLCTTR